METDKVGAADVTNVRPRDAAEVMWDPAKPVESLRDLRKAVEEEGQKAIDWYWRSKRWKANLSRAIQFYAVVLTALAGLASIVVELLRNSGVRIPATFDSGTIATLFVGTAAALIALDKAFGFSSGWTRYVLTATSMTKLLHEFRVDWVALVAGLGNPPKPEESALLIQKAKDFISGIQALVLQETKDWATEFQNNMAQMDKDLKAQLEALKAQVEKSIQEKDDAAKPGAIELNVSNADKTDGFHFVVTLVSAAGTITGSVSNSKVWANIGTAPGHYTVTVQAIIGGNPKATSAVVDIKPSEIAKVSLDLPMP